MSGPLQPWRCAVRGGWSRHLPGYPLSRPAPLPRPAAHCAEFKFRGGETPNAITT